MFFGVHNPILDNYVLSTHYSLDSMRVIKRELECFRAYFLVVFLVAFLVVAFLVAVFFLGAAFFLVVVFFLVAVFFLGACKM